MFIARAHILEMMMIMEIVAVVVGLCRQFKPI